MVAPPRHVAAPPPHEASAEPHDGTLDEVLHLSEEELKLLIEEEYQRSMS
jgi:hypothetical protein